MKTRESLELTKPEKDGLVRLAKKTKSVTTSGPTAGKASWRVLVARLGRGEVQLKEQNGQRNDEQSNRRLGPGH